MAVRWVRTTPMIYRGIYAVHKPLLQVFGTFTSQDEMLTEWGFANADYPLIKSEMRKRNEGGPEEWTYSIALVQKDED